ncbi:ORF6N domain-containing protein [candidate division WOR-3 bacterium]|nr:ORF6N domain-containing protein [candidate division WOR-3 bacterium]
MKDSVIDNQTIVPIEIIEKRIYLFRGKKVMIDSHLAELYGVQTKVLVQAVKRNIDRFPKDFMFQLTKDEFDALRSQIVTSNEGRGGRRYPPYAFTEQGVAMLSSVLHSKRAIRVNLWHHPKSPTGKLDFIKRMKDDGLVVLFRCSALSLL